MTTHTPITNTRAARRTFRRGAIPVGLALAIACMAATSASAGPGTISGSVYDPATGQTTTIVRTPGAADKVSIEIGNTLNRHRFDPPRRVVTKPISGGIYNPRTDMTITLTRTPLRDKWGRVAGNGLR